VEEDTYPVSCDIAHSRSGVELTPSWSDDGECAHTRGELSTPDRTWPRTTEGGGLRGDLGAATSAAATNTGTISAKRMVRRALCFTLVQGAAA
jgi:hypothetical protein